MLGNSWNGHDIMLIPINHCHGNKTLTACETNSLYTAFKILNIRGSFCELCPTTVALHRKCMVTINDYTPHIFSMEKCHYIDRSFDLSLNISGPPTII